jgi:ferredoxin
MILYFSGTGNSLYVAKRLARENEKLVDMAVSSDYAVCDKRVGIIFPCYCSDIPRKVAEFLGKAVIKTDYAFAVCTCGADSGKSFGSIQYILCGKGQKLACGKKIVMPDSCVIFGFPQNIVKQLLSTADDRIDAVKAEIENGAVSEIAASKPNGIFSRFMWFAFNDIVGVRHKKSDKNCTGCGLCAELCPRKNIKIVGGRAVFGDDCVNCFRCINSCGHYAVKFGLLKNTPSKRYIHPGFDGKKENNNG